MKTIKKFSIFIFCLVFYGSYTMGQKTAEKARLLFENQEYYEAAGLFEQLYKKAILTDEKAGFARKLGDCYAAFLDYEKAAGWYASAYNEKKDNETLALWADMLWSSGMYAEALDKYKSLLSVTPSDERLKMRASSCRLAMDEMRKTPATEVGAVTELNTPYSDYSPVVCGKYMFFSSSRFGKDKIRHFSYDGQNYSDIYTAVYDSAARKWTKTVPLPEAVNGKFNEGTVAYDKTNGQLFFMRCNEISGKGRLCRIFESRVDPARNKASEVRDVAVGFRDYSAGHPCISSDGRIMFFVSDNPDGIGGKDIYVSARDEKGEWSAPENMGVNINTTSDEMFPALQGDTILYFSSNGRIGMGGLDIYKVRVSGKNITGKVIPLPYPVNTAGDDFGICPLDAGSGYFSSNRKNGTGSDDIYYYRPIPFVLSAKGHVKDKITGVSLAKTLIIVKLGDEIIDTTMTDEQGMYYLQNLLSNSVYSIRAVKEGYIPQEKTLSTSGESKTRELSAETGHDIDFALFKVTREEITINNIYYDFDKWDLRKESESELDKIVTLLMENKEMRIQINSHTDNRGSDAYNLQLSANRAQSVVDYLVAHGIQRDRLLFKGWGESRLLISNAQSEEEHQLNRRTTFNLINAGDFSDSYYEKIYDEIEASNRKNRAGSFFRIYLGNEDEEGFGGKMEEIRKQFPAETTITLSEDGNKLVYMGAYVFIDEALAALDVLKSSGFTQSYIAAFRNNQKIGLVKLQ